MPRLRQVALVLLLGVATVGGALADSATDAFDALVNAVREHQAALARVLALQEADVARAKAEITRRKDLAARELIARRDVDEAERAADWLAAAVERTRADIGRADTLIVEARAALIPPVAPGHERETPDHIAFGGTGGWSLARASAIDRFFTRTFHRPLPVSALGQTALHDQLGFDHRAALDVAIHPDTREGRALVAYLRSEGIPFIAFRAVETGVSTGAHIHIGEPSPRRPVGRPQADASSR